ncbi:MAG: cytochrome ubiquinol oxidase subunit I, partial [Terasakiella sp.]|nr:cytochrome ubiquinol oxidase subunit I [Terasakiella sp.]
EALRLYDVARAEGDSAAMAAARADFEAAYPYFGYGYLDSPQDAVPPVALTFYAFRVMVIIGGYLLLLFLGAIFACTRRTSWLEKPWLHWVGIISIPLVWICSQAGWIVAEVGRQPWVIQDLMPTGAAISANSTAAVQTTFWLFAVLFTLLLVAEISIMLRYIARMSRTDIITNPKI